MIPSTFGEIRVVPQTSVPEINVTLIEARYRAGRVFEFSREPIRAGVIDRAIVKLPPDYCHNGRVRFSRLLIATRENATRVYVRTSSRADTLAIKRARAWLAAALSQQFYDIRLR